MKKTLKIIVGIIIMFSPIIITTQIHAVEMQITVPSDKVEGQELCKIASGRSFYVKGNLQDGENISNNAKMTIKLINKESSNEVRTVSTNIKDNKTLNTDYSVSKISFYTPVTALEVASSGMPDLVWDGNDTSTFYNGSMKCYYNSTSFSALICGGKGTIDDTMNWKDGNGNNYETLQEGIYTIKVTLEDSGNVVASTQKDIQIGSTGDKILSRFSPSSHFDKVTKFAKEKGLRVYLDPFPGYWSGSVFAEILPEWRACDMMEYSTGKAHFVIYNVKESSATYSVELAQIQKMNDIDNENRLVNYYYTYGEPQLGGKESDISEFDHGDKLQFARADIEDNGTKTEENVYDVDSTEKVQTDLNVMDGITVESGEILSLFGVVTPIQLDETDIVDKGNNSYQLNNRIKTLEYKITGTGINITQEKSVELNRIISGWDNYSVMEFKHDIKILSEWAGKTLKVKVSGIDSKGSKVSGTDETFEIKVKNSATETTTIPKTTLEKDTSENPTIGKTAIKSASKIKKSTKAKISLKKIKKVSGYQVKISLSKKFKKSKKYRTKTQNFNKTTFTIKKLKKNRKYYVKARAYRNVNGKKKYGKWTKTVKIKFLKKK